MLSSSSGDMPNPSFTLKTDLHLSFTSFFFTKNWSNFPQSFFPSPRAEVSEEFRERRKCIKGNFFLIKGHRKVPACIDACSVCTGVHWRSVQGAELWVLCTDWGEPGLWKPLFLTKKVSRRVQKKGKVAFGGGISDCFYVLGSVSWGNVRNRVYFFYFNCYLIHWGFLKGIADFLCLLFCLSCSFLAYVFLKIIFPETSLSPPYDSWLRSLAGIFFLHEEINPMASQLSAGCGQRIIIARETNRLKSRDRGLGPCECWSRWI